MADVKYIVSVDSAGAVTQIKQLDKAWEDLNKTGKETKAGAEQTGAATAGLWKQMAIGTLVAQGVQKAFGAVVGAMKDGIRGAIEEEESENRLKTAIETTGRTIAGNLDFYKRFAASKMETTKYTHEEIEASSTLLLQLTNLNQQGIKKAVEGAMGLSAVMGTDLQSATMMVTKAMEGNYTALQRVGIKVDESLSPQEKQAALLEKLGALYPRAEAELNTFGGQVKQLSNYWDEVKESLGAAIIGNEDVRKSAKELTEGLRKMVDSDRFKLWLSSLTEVITAVVKGLGAIGKAIVSIEDKLFGAKGWEKYVAQENLAHASIIEGVRIQELRRKAIDQDILSIRDWGEMIKRYGRDNQAVMKAIAEGKEGPKIKALYDDLKAGAQAAAEKQKEALPVVNETGAGISKAATAAAELKKELKLVFSSELEAELRKNETALREFQTQLSPKSAEELKKRIAELKVQLGATVTDAEKVDAVFKQLGVQDMATAAENTRILTLAQARLNTLYEAGTIDLLEYDQQTKALNEELEKNRTLVVEKLPPAHSAWAKMAIENAKHITVWTGNFAKSAAEKWEEFGDRAAIAMERVQKVWSTVNASMTAVVQQAQQNRQIAIENEYKKRLAVINSTIKDEDKKQKALTALEAEFQIKRTAAAAAGAKQAKAVALMEAVVNTASGVARAFKDYAFPLSAVIAGIVGALGAVQIALIAKQPIPLARGAVFKKPTVMTTTEGATYEVGEQGTEYLVPERHLAALARGGLPGLRPAAAGAGSRSFTININSPLISTSGLSSSELEAAGPRLFAILEREARRRGRS